MRPRRPSFGASLRAAFGTGAAVLGFAAGLVASLCAAAPVRAWDWDGAAWADYRPYLGPIDAAAKAHLQSIAAGANSFYREHGKGSAYGNHGGWRLSDAVADGHPNDAVEIGDGTTPGDFSWALVMFGTNDIDAGNWNAAAWKE